MSSLGLGAEEEDMGSETAGAAGLQTGGTWKPNTWLFFASLKRERRSDIGVGLMNRRASRTRDVWAGLCTRNPEGQVRASHCVGLDKRGAQTAGDSSVLNVSRSQSRGFG